MSFDYIIVDKTELENQIFNSIDIEDSEIILHGENIYKIMKINENQDEVILTDIINDTENLIDKKIKKIEIERQDSHQDITTYSFYDFKIETEEDFVLFRFYCENVNNKIEIVKINDARNL